MYWTDIIREIKSRRRGYVGHVGRTGEIRNSCNILVRKPERKRALGRPMHRWEDNNRWALGKQGGKVWPGCIWHRIETSGRLL
jgi:hypothetical protein